MSLFLVLVIGTRLILANLLIGGYLLPKASKCKLIFLQAILYGQKKCLR